MHNHSFDHDALGTPGLGHLTSLHKTACAPSCLPVPAVAPESKGAAAAADGPAPAAPAAGAGAEAAGAEGAGDGPGAGAGAGGKKKKKKKKSEKKAGDGSAADKVGVLAQFLCRLKACCASRSLLQKIYSVLGCMAGAAPETKNTYLVAVL